MAWDVIEDALRVWVKAGTGLDDAHVIWAEQTGARPPSGTFATLRLGDVLPVGMDELVEETDLLRPAGEEVEQRVVGLRQFMVSVQLFSRETVSNSSARSLLAQAQTYLSMPTVRASLEAAGLTVYDLGRVQNVTALNGTRFEGRAVLEVGFYCLETASEFTGFIETCEPVSYMGPPELGTKEEIDI